MSSGGPGTTVRIRVFCEEPSHAQRSVVVASFKRGLKPGEPQWRWEEEKAWGTTGVNDEWTGEPVYKNGYRPATDEERAQGLPSRVDLPHRFAVREEDKTSDVLECPRCGLRLQINRERWTTLLTKMSDAGLNRVGLRELVATMT